MTITIQMMNDSDFDVTLSGSPEAIAYAKLMLSLNGCACKEVTGESRCFYGAIASSLPNKTNPG